MTLTREVAAAILERYGECGRREFGDKWVFDRLLRKHGLSAFSDEFVEALARENGRERRRRESMNARNRTIYAARFVLKGMQS